MRLRRTDLRQTTKLHVGLPNIPDEDIFFRWVEDMLATRRLTNGGPLVRQFEERVTGFVGTRHAAAVCNATLGLQIAAKALGLTGEVIMPSFTFIATAHALEWIGLKPVFVDIGPADHNIDPDQIVAAVTSRTSAVVGVHVWGAPCCTAAIQALAQDHGLRVFYDASHAFFHRMPAGK
jgi:dTDP-4-amino-4,6-dideoxyglucose